MDMIRFIHCADLHLGTPFRGIGLENQALAARLSRATFNAFDAIVERAIAEKVDFVLIAGDVFDRDDQSLAVRLFFRQALQRLDNADIKSYIVCGNHDPLQSWSRTITLPESSHIFGAEEPQNLIVELNNNVAVEICGMSYPQRVVTDNLAIRFKRSRRDLPGIALLHANIGGAVGYESYAPASISDLVKSGFAYWALGHVHEFALLRESAPAVVYPGCPQGTNPREQDEKGACLVELSLESGIPPAVVFFPTDTIRYTSQCLDVTGATSFDELFDAVGTLGKNIVSANAGRQVILRLDLTGNTAFDAELRHAEDNRELADAIQRQLDDMGLDIWLERVNLRLRRDYDVDAISERGGFVADVISIANTAMNDHDELQELCEALAPLKHSCRELSDFSADELQRIVDQAQHLVLDKLLGGVQK